MGDYVTEGGITLERAKSVMAKGLLVRLPDESPSPPATGVDQTGTTVTDASQPDAQPDPSTPADPVAWAVPIPGPPPVAPAPSIIPAGPASGEATPSVTARFSR